MYRSWTSTAAHMANVQHGKSRALSSDMGDEKDDAFLDLARRAVKKIERRTSSEEVNSFSRAATAGDVERMGSSKGLAPPVDTRQHRFPSITSLGSPVPPLDSPHAARRDMTLERTRRDISSEQQGAARRRPEPSSTEPSEPSSRPESGDTLYICDKGRLNFLPRPPVSAEERLRWLEDDEGASGRRGRREGLAAGGAGVGPVARMGAHVLRQVAGPHSKAPSGEEEAEARLDLTRLNKRAPSSPVPVWENTRFLDEAPCGRKWRLVPEFLKRLWAGAGKEGGKASGR